VRLKPGEVEALFFPGPEDGLGEGFQTFLASLRRRVDQRDGTLLLTPMDLDRIPQFASSGGSQENVIRAVFGRALGPALDGRAG
jgi:hypothetical protein